MELTKEMTGWVEDHYKAHYDLLLELAQIPAPSNHEELRAEFIRDWFEKEGCHGAYIDSALNVIYPFHCEEQKELVAFSAHIDTVFRIWSHLTLSTTVTSCAVQALATTPPSEVC